MSKKGVFTIEDLERKSQSVKTMDKNIWVNLTDGRFIRLDTSMSQKPICISSVDIYPKIKTVMYNRIVIASRQPKHQTLSWKYHN